MFARLYFVLLAAIMPISLHAADFSLTDIQGRTHSLKAYQGKWVLVNLWATWCAPCIEEMPELEALSKSRPNLVVLGLAVDGSNQARVKQFAEKLGVSYPIIAGNEKLAQQFKTKGYPTSVLYDPNGKQALLKEGIVNRREIESVIDAK